MTQLSILQDYKLEILAFFPPEMWETVEAVFEYQQPKLQILGLFDHDPERERSPERFDLINLLCQIWDDYDREHIGDDGVMPFRRHVFEVNLLRKEEGN